MKKQKLEVLVELSRKGWRIVPVGLKGADKKYVFMEKGEMRGYYNLENGTFCEYIPLERREK